MAMYFYIAMEIRDIQGNILIDTLVTQDAVKVDELMKQHNITLSWVAVSNEQLPLGAYIDYDGVRYSLLEPYSPEQTDEATYNYKPIFHHPVMRWQYLPFFHYTDSNKELDWSLTDNAANFMSAICKAIENETGEDWSYEVSSALPASASLSFSNTDIFSALNSIAGAFETEWWFDYSAKVVYLSKAYNGSAVTLEVGKNIGVPSKTGSKEGYFTRFYAFGSTRNIEQNYAGSNVNSIVNKRLTLDPQKYPDGYIDIREGLTNSEVLVKTLVFDDIYPRSSLIISDVKVRLMWRLDDDNKKVPIGTDAEGKPVYDQYAIWYFKIPGLEFNKDSIISGKPLSVHFNSGSLNGREFDLTYHSEEKTVETSDGIDFVVEPGDYEINFIEEGTYIIPSITGLIPVEGDEITLFNIVMPEEYKTSAYSELERAVRSEMAKQGSDTNNYSFSSNKVAFYESNPNLSIGRSVVFKNGSQVLNTRVIKLETQLDHPFEQKITVGNEQIKGTTQTLREEVVSANENIDLISAINKNTEAFTQSLQKTQKAVQNSLAKWAEMWNYDKEHDAARTKLNLIVEKSITFGGAKEGEGEGEGGGSTGITSFDVFVGNNGPYPLKDGKVNLPAYPVVPNALPNPFKLTINGTPYDGSAPVDIEVKAGVDDAQLSEYAKKGWVEQQGYIKEIPSDVITEDELGSKGYATEKWVNSQGFLTAHQSLIHLLSKEEAADTYQPKGDYAVLDDLNSYLLSSTAKNTYATKTALNNAIQAHDELREEFDALNGLLTDDTSGYIDTWNEVKSFLDGYSESQDLATILSGMNKDIANRATIEALNAATTRISTLEATLVIEQGYIDTLQSYFTSGKAKKAIADGNGNNIVDTYATKVALKDIADKVASLQDMWFFDEAHANTIRTLYNVVVDKAISFGGYGESSGSGGGITTVTYDMVIQALGFTPYNSSNPKGYITSSVLSSYATQNWVTENYQPKGDYLTSATGVTLSTDQTITGIKTFSNGLKIGSTAIAEKTKNSTKYVEIDGNLVVTGAISFGGFGEGGSTGGGITTVTKDMVISALGYTPYNAANPNGYITSSALNGYATTSWVNSGFYSAEVSRFANTVLAAPNGYDGFATFRKLVAADIPNLNWSKITSGKPTTLSGYGITDAYTKAAADSAFLGLNTLGIDADGVTNLNQVGYGYATGGWYGSGPALAFGSTNGYTALIQQGISTQTLYVSYKANGGDIQDWKTIAFTDSNVASATKLKTARTLWGQSFDGTKNISGSLSDVTTITATGNISTDGNLVTSSDVYGNYFLIKNRSSNPYYKLTDGSYSGYVQLLTDGSMALGSTSAYSLTVYSDGNTRVNGNLVATGSITFGSASDRRLKDNIKSITDKQAVAVLKALNPVTFKWNSTAYELGKLSGISDGFIADEYEKLIPNSGRDIWANYRAINYERATGYLVKGWQKHQSEIEKLRDRVNELENELKQYRRA